MDDIDMRQVPTGRDDETKRNVRDGHRHATNAAHRNTSTAARNACPLCARLRRMAVYGLPINTNPAVYCWPVSGHNIAIVGMLSIPRLHRLMAALLRDGAASIAGLDIDGQLHTAVADSVEVAA